MTQPSEGQQNNPDHLDELARRHSWEKIAPLRWQRMKLWLVVWIVCLIATGIAFSTSEPIDLRMIAVVPIALFGWIPAMRNFIKAKAEERAQNESDCS